ncbi:MAG: 3-hydroxyacyl-CoA dehydrogenase family protein [Bacteroidales bacterium]|nr:3-hydroxyacyl-CoA dehydrogenase family protein [Bacteroidales bacterium]MCF8388629.1 3-hydroxyacyl-CoA dehydrogenase family protein [Bacteroidales bacterium]MCF8397398.1 3-hydroxyacyl-CoA dehydrogenase family protein [Bacteroidales bacterium]
MKKERLEDFSLGGDATKKSGVFKLGIVGCGTMGQEIAMTASSRGIEVVFIDVSDERIQTVMNSIESQLQEKINHWGMTSSDMKSILSRIHGYVGYEVLRECRMVIEAVMSKKNNSSLPLRHEIFEKIENVVDRETVIASNASTKVIDDLSVVLEHPERAIGMHFLSPVMDVEVIEINRSWKTSDDAFKTVVQLAKMMNKQIIHVNGTPGNVSTRIIIPMINEACQLLMEGVSTVKEIDECMQFGFGMQLGPFALADKIGLDKLIKWMEGLFNEYGNMIYKPSPILKRLVRAGFVGMHAGEGFYIYENGERKEKQGSIYSLGKD